MVRLIKGNFLNFQTKENVLRSKEENHGMGVKYKGRGEEGKRKERGKEKEGKR